MNEKNEKIINDFKEFSKATLDYIEFIKESKDFTQEEKENKIGEIKRSVIDLSLKMLDGLQEANQANSSE